MLTARASNRLPRTTEDDFIRVSLECLSRSEVATSNKVDSRAPDRAAERAATVQMKYAAPSTA
jgi:hypothetical protein